MFSVALLLMIGGSSGCRLQVYGIKTSTTKSSREPGGGSGGSGSTDPRIYVGLEHSCRISSDGFECWGENGDSQLGDGGTSDASFPVEGSLSDATLGDAGPSVSCGIESGSLYCWGDNSWGQIGNGATDAVTPVSAPFRIPGLSGVTAVSIGLKHACAIAGGAVKCWGENDSGQLGDGTTTDRLSPAAVTGLGSGVTAIATGGEHSCALKTDSTLWCWGRNASGELGDGSNASSPTPVQVTGVTGPVTSLSAGYYTTCAVDAGAAKCWGAGSMGQLGDWNYTDSNVPITATGLGSGVTRIASGGDWVCAIADDVYCWGYNNDGTSMGIGFDVDSGIPYALGFASVPVEIDVWATQACAIWSDETTKCWGSNGSGQLGDGTTTDRLSPVSVVRNRVTLAGAGSVGYQSCEAYTATLAHANATALTFTLGGNGASARFYGDAACSGAPITELSFAAGATSRTFYFMHTSVAGARTLAATGAEETAGGSLTIALDQPSLSVAGDVILAPDTCGAFAATVSQALVDDVTLSLSVTTGAGDFYADSTCSGSVVTSVDLLAGSTSVNFYYLPQNVLSHGIDVSGTGLDNGTTSANVDQTNNLLVSGSTTPVVGACTPYTVALPRIRVVDTTIDLTTLGAAAAIYTDPACSGLPFNQVTIQDRTDSATFYVQAQAPGALWISADSAGVYFTGTVNATAQ